MAESPDLSELVRRTMEANARFYQGWVELSVEYFRGITEALSGAQVARPAAAGGAVDPGEASAPGAVILEGVDGETATGAFLVSNDLGRTLECELSASEIADADGAAAAARVSFEPASFELEPGEQKVVRAMVPVPDTLEPGVAYSGTFGIKGLEGFSVPVVLRRVHAVEVSPIDDIADTAADAGKARESSSGAGTAKTAKTATKKAKTATGATDATKKAKTATSATDATKKSPRKTASKKTGGAGRKKGGGRKSSSGKGSKKG